jgi:hypothetical protein
MSEAARAKREGWEAEGREVRAESRRWLRDLGLQGNSVARQMVAERAAAEIVKRRIRQNLERRGLFQRNGELRSATLKYIDLLSSSVAEWRRLLELIPEARPDEEVRIVVERRDRWPRDDSPPPVPPEMTVPEAPDLALSGPPLNERAGGNGEAASPSHAATDQAGGSPAFAPTSRTRKRR